jgi:nitroimidazol reductase NimA-like FMN-containing flavoprotein (pyridoxamine 5'-phosphate oxidase superfamily)
MGTHEQTNLSERLDREERATLLGTGGTGVISLSTEDDAPPHSIPVSYGFDPAEETFYFRLAVGFESGKTDLLDRGVAFVVYEQANERWQSIVARGDLEQIEGENIGTEALAGLGRSHIPLFGIFDRPTREVEFAIYRLIPDQLSGRREAAIRE